MHGFMRRIDRVVRATAIAGLLTLTASCQKEHETERISEPGFTAQFEAPGGHVQLDYADPENFRFRTETGGRETFVVNGEIYVVWPSGDRLIAWHAGRLKPAGRRGFPGKGRH